ncbi:hypothetical protein, partial [Thermoflexibacter ruber]
RTTTLDPHGDRYVNVSGYSFLNNNPLRYIDPTGRDVTETAWGTRYTGVDAQNMFRQLQQRGSNRDLPKPEVSTQTRMYQTFKYNDNCRDCGVDMIAHQTTTTTIQRDDRGRELYRMTELSTTTVTIDAKGEISNSLTQGKITIVTINSKKGVQTSNYVESNTIPVSDKSYIGSISKDLEKAATSVADFKQKNGISPIQQIARDKTNDKDFYGTVGTYVTYGGGFVSTIGLAIKTPPLLGKTIELAGYGLTMAGVYVTAAGNSINTNPENMIIKLK